MDCLPTAAATTKFRPVLMSCAAALVGMLPMALGGGLGSELRQSMGIGSVGGILVSTLVSLYFIPALCACFHPYPTFLMRAFEAASASALVLAELPADTSAIPG